MSDEVLKQFLEANRLAQERMGLVGGENRWAGSAFEWLMSLPSRRRGKAGEEIAAAWLDLQGLEVRPPLNSGHDRLVEGRRVEIKFSTLWEQGDYVFQQLRNQDYEFVLMIGVSPTTAHAWLIPKSTAFERAAPQHGGAAGTDTRWLRFAASAPPSWMGDFGGELSEAEEVVRQQLRQSP